MPETIDSGVHIRAIVWTGAAILATLVLAGAGAYFTWTAWVPDDAHDAPNAALDFTVSEPVLESAPQEDRTAYRAEKDRRLHGYEWIDRQAGIARIPIEQAMRILSDASGAEQNR